MKKLWAFWGGMNLLFFGFSQTLQVTDHESGQSLEFATISGEPSGTVLVTDAHGKSAISSLSDDTLIIRMVGYDPLQVSFNELASQGFHATLLRSSTLLGEVVVSSFRELESRETSLHIEPISFNVATTTGAFSLTAVLAHAAGVTQLSSGIGISKPVIRGLYGNRILVLFSGLRFDNQQWQDEHGLGLSDVGVSGVEIIKGPMSILYGTEAVGGVINILEESAPAVGTSETDTQLSFHSNTMGGTWQAGYKANYGNQWVRFRISALDHADYSDGNGDRVLNSRFKGYQFKTTYGLTRYRWTSVNHYQFSFNKFGFVFDDLGTYFEADNRWRRTMDGPHHNVMLHVISSINKFQLKDSQLDLTAGLQSNLRSEDEGGGELSLKMHLLTGQYALKWRKRLNECHSLVITNYSSIESNINYGRRKLVPDAWMAESALSAYLAQTYPQVTVEYGVGGGVRSIKTLLTPAVNSAEKEIDPFNKLRTFANGMAGASFSPFKDWSLKLNASTGVRSPNLSELSSNGLHEGIYTYEIGNPNMKNEHNANLEVGVYYAGSTVRFSAAAYSNQFLDYIYLEPTTEDWFGFPVYRFTQHNASINGTELTAAVTPAIVNGLTLSTMYVALVGKLGNGTYLPYMPAQKIKPEIRFDRKKEGSTFYTFVNTDFIFAQHRLNPEERTTPAYTLVNAGLGYQFIWKKAYYDFGITANNFLNDAYYDHLSRFKNFGLLNIGRDLSINLKVKFSNQLKTKQ